MNKLRKHFSALLLCIFLLALLPLTVLADPPLDSDEICTLTVSFVPEDVPARDVEFKIYRVAEVLTSGDYKLIAPYEDETLKELLTNPDAEKYSTAVTTLKGMLAGNDAIEPTKTGITNGNGLVKFTELETGLYLIVGSTYHGDEWFYIPQDYMVCIPDRSDNREWNYDVFSSVKWEKRPDTEPVDMEVLKVWADSATNLHSGDSVVVELYKNGKLYDTQVLSQDNAWTYRWWDLYGGASWTLKEQTLSGYTTKIEKINNFFLVTNTPENYNPPVKPIPQTGLLWWPVPVLAALGLVLIVIGMFRRSKGKKDES